MSLSLNRYRNLDRTDIEAAIKFVQGSLDSKDAPSWIKRFKKEDRKITIKKNNLFIDGLMIVGNNERDTLRRSIIYEKDRTVAPSRDAGYYTIKKKYLNISRRNWTDFLKKQRVIRMTDNAPPKQKKGGNKFIDRARSKWICSLSPKTMFACSPSMLMTKVFSNRSP